MDEEDKDPPYIHLEPGLAGTAPCRLRRRQLAFYRHLLACLGVGMLLVGLNSYLRPDYPWSWWAAGVLALSVLLHGVKVFARRRRASDSQEEDHSHVSSPGL